MNIAVLGTGNIGRTLGKKWASAGHTVNFGSREAGSEKSLALARDLPMAIVATVPAALATAEVIVLAIPGRVVEEMLDAHAALFAGKIVIDATNQVTTPVMSSLEAIAAKAPTALVYRAFNSLGWENFEQPQFGDTQADHFFCGPAGESQSIVARLIADIGLQPIYLGGPEQAPLLDAMTRLWFTLVNRQQTRHLAFKVLM